MMDRTERITFRLTRFEREALEQAAERAGTTPSAEIRRAIRHQVVAKLDEREAVGASR